MTDTQEHQLRFLIVEDSSFYRTAVVGMLNSIGFVEIDGVQNGNQALEACRSHHYDIILCDYDLGFGKTGQQVLEALRHHKLIDRKTLFIMVTSDTSRHAVLASYECCADDYVTKPINAKLIQRRVSRLASQAEAFAEPLNAIEAGALGKAISLLKPLLRPGGRHQHLASKLIGEVLIKANALDKAEAHYKRVLTEKPFEWAQLGLAFIEQARGNLTAANKLFNLISKENPYCLAAYDGLAKSYHLQKDFRKLQKAIASAVKASPRSILRQKNLANIAEQNGDIQTALAALRECVTLGYHSCYGDWQDAYRFGMNTADAPPALLEEKDKLPHEALKILKDATNYFNVSTDDMLRMQFLQGRLQFLSRQHLDGQQSIHQAETLYCERDKRDVVTDVARVKALRTIEENTEAKNLTNELKEQYQDDQAGLEKLDEILDEPLSTANRKLLAEANKRGIELYNKAQFDEAIHCFQRAQAMFPRHIGVQLNICQAYLGKRTLGQAGKVDLAIEQILESIRQQISPEDPQHKRYRKLYEMAKSS